jgi:glycosyltransferase involved in cell wall biosynthesis
VTEGSGVVVLTSTFPASPGDGTPEFVLALSRELARHRPVTVVAPRVRGAKLHETFGDVEVVRFRYFPRPWEGLADGAIMPNLRAEPWRCLEVPPFLLAYLWTALRTVRRRRPAVVNAHWVVPAGIVARILRAITGVPYVITAHGADAFVLRKGLPLRLKRWVLGGASEVLPVSEEIAQVLADLGARSIRVAPMGVDVAAVRNATSPRRPEDDRLLFVGRLAGKKGVPVLLRALAALPEVRLVLVGDGPDRADLEQLATELGIADRVTFRGQQPKSQVEAELRCACALVVPSVVDVDGDKDGTPVVLPEALAAGVPVVASDLAGLGEHLRDGVSGLLVAPGDVEALTGALRRVTGDGDLRAHLTEEGAKLVARVFDLPVVGQTYADAFDRAAAP